MNLDLQPTQLSADSIRTLLPLLDQTGAKSISGNHAKARDTTYRTENPLPTSYTSAKVGRVWVWQTDNDNAARANSFSL